MLLISFKKMLWKEAPIFTCMSFGYFQDKYFMNLQYRFVHGLFLRLESYPVICAMSHVGICMPVPNTFTYLQGLIPECLW